MSGKKAICQFCKSSSNVEEVLKVLAKEIQKVNKKLILNKDKRKEISELSGTEVLDKGAKIGTMTFKKGKRLGNVDYIKCSNKEHLATERESEKEFIIHKYYFTCPFFKEAE